MGKQLLTPAKINSSMPICLDAEKQRDFNQQPSTKYSTCKIHYNIIQYNIIQYNTI